MNKKYSYGRGQSSQESKNESEFARVRKEYEKTIIVHKSVNAQVTTEWNAFTALIHLTRNQEHIFVMILMKGEKLKLLPDCWVL